MVFQSYALFPNMTVADNIAFGLKMRKRAPADIKRRVGELLELIHLRTRATATRTSCRAASSSASRWPGRSPSSRPVLLLDEPLSALDAKIRVALRHEIREIQRQLGSRPCTSPTTRRRRSSCPTGSWS